MDHLARKMRSATDGVSTGRSRIEATTETTVIAGQWEGAVAHPWRAQQTEIGIT